MSLGALALSNCLGMNAYALKHRIFCLNLLLSLFMFREHGRLHFQTVARARTSFYQ